MLSVDWCWLVFPTLAAARQFRAELVGTLGVEDVPTVGLSEPIELEEGRAGWVSHYWARSEAIMDQIEILATHSRYKGRVWVGRTPPPEWRPVQPPEEV